MKISVTRALVELKNLDKKITQAIGSGVFLGTTVGTDNQKKMAVTGNQDIEAAKSTIQGNFDRVCALIDNRQKIKAAVVLSNASTQVTLGGKIITVAEAIETKTTLPYKESFLNALKQQFTFCQNQVQTQSTKLEEDIDKMLAVVYGNDKGKIQPEAYAQIAEPRRKERQPAILDPIKIESKIKASQDEIQLIQSELDFVLAESNAKTEIEVDI